MINTNNRGNYNRYSQENIVDHYKYLDSLVENLMTISAPTIYHLPEICKLDAEDREYVREKWGGLMHNEVEQ